MTHPVGKVRVSVPIRDTYKDGAPVAFIMDLYGIPVSQLTSVQMSADKEYPDGHNPHIGAGPIRAALEKRGISTIRYQPFLFDIWEATDAKKVEM